MASFFAIENKLPKNIMLNICILINRVLEYFVSYKEARRLKESGLKDL